ncbi:MAG: DUF1152 domain-containing protein [Solirubrobacterales bacterium]
MLGIGGGGDVVGSLAVARWCEQLGAEAVLGGVAWERMPIDPYPGPRSVDQIQGGRRAGERAVIADPRTTTPQGVPFSESRVAGHLGADTVLIDITAGASGTAAGVESAAAELLCDLVAFVDIGGDAIAAGSESGLASPLCDAVMLAAAIELDGRLPTVGAVLGAGCDGELEPREVLDRVAALARVGAWTGTRSVTREIADAVEAAAAETKTEASLQVVRCARGETGLAEIRGGRRTVALSPLGALAFFFDPVAAAPELPLATAVGGSTSLERAQEALNAIGVATELDYERRRAAERQ